MVDVTRRHADGPPAWMRPLPRSLDGIISIVPDGGAVAEVVPILRKRGLFREEYTGSTLRDHLGLPRPDSLYAEERRESA